MTRSGRSSRFPSWRAISWAIVFSTLGGYGLYYVCLARSGAVRTTSLIYITPGLTLVWAWAMFGQPMSAYTWVGLVLLAWSASISARGEQIPAPRLRTEET